MSAAETASPLESLLVLQSLLDGLLQWLAPEEAEGQDPANLEPLLDEALDQASQARLGGVTELLRIWAAAINHRARVRALFDESEKAGLHTWFSGLLAFCQGQLPTERQRELLDQLSTMPRLAPLPPRLRAHLEDRLGESESQIQALLLGFDSELLALDEPLLAVDEPLPAFETDALPVDEPVLMEATDPVPRAVDTIWVSPEEIQLALEAVGSQILPLIMALSETDDAELLQLHLSELEFQLGLVGNAMEMLGTPALSQGILAVQASANGVEAIQPETLAGWSAALIAFLEDPCEDNAEFLGMFADDIPGACPNWTEALKAEARRIRIGMDPALSALRKSEALPEDVELLVAPDVLPNVLDGMFRELPGNAERLGNSIRRLVASGDTAPIDEARRIAHTLKGDANTVGIRGLANLTHSLEDLLIELHKRPELLVPDLGLALDSAADCVEEIADYLLGRGPAPRDVLAIYQSILDWSNAVLTDAEPAPEILARRTASRDDTARDHEDMRLLHSSSASMHGETASLPSQSPAADTGDAQDARTATLTVSAELLDELQRLAGETLVTARQIDQRLARLEHMHREQVAEVRNASSLLGKLDDLITLRGAALQSTALRGGSEVDPLELDQYNELHVVSRRLLESNADNSEYQQRLDLLISELDGLRSDQETVHADLQRMVQRARTVPFDQISGRLQRIVRQTGRQLDRPVELTVVGEQTLLDAELLDRVVEPLAHLLRNAIDHGLEDGATRRAAGKSETGSIKISVATVADSVEIRVEDNGRGLDFSAIRAKAISLGVVAENQALSDTELARLILAPGFTTRSHTTQVSGRGIGMDVVNQRIIDLRGQLSLSSMPGLGMVVSMRLPVSQTVANVIIAHGHGLILAAVAGSVERVHNFTVDDLTYSEDGHVVLSVDGEQLPLYPVETLYGRSEGRLSIPVGNGLGLLVTSPRGRRVVVGVASISEVIHVIVKPISSSLPPVPSVRGMTLLGDGRLAAVVDIGTLIDVLDADTAAWRLTDLSAEQVQLPRVVVADDSLSVRRALTQLMEDAGYEVFAARDGLEALELINETLPKLVLLDLEMPKLNGLEVTRSMRGRDQTRDVPVLMITSRASDKYRALAEDAGVTMMLGKPVAEDDLIATVRSLMEATATKVALENT